MIIKGMVDAWEKRTSNDGVVLPAAPAGTSPLDEVYLESIVGGAADSIDFFTFVCSSGSLPPSYACGVTTGTCS